MEAPSYIKLAEAADISKSYAHEIVKLRRSPSRPLAIHIFRTTGWKASPIAALTDEQIAMLETVEPWKPSTSSVAAA